MKGGEFGMVVISHAFSLLSIILSHMVRYVFEEKTMVCPSHVVLLSLKAMSQ